MTSSTCSSTTSAASGPATWPCSRSAAAGGPERRRPNSPRSLEGTGYSPRRSGRAFPASDKVGPARLAAIAAFACGVLALGGPAGPPVVRAADCTRTSVGLTPLTELGTGGYKGFAGGLYPGGGSEPAGEHLAAAMARSAAVEPLGADGTPAADGRIVLLSVGMSNTTQEFSRFVALAQADPQLHPALLVVDGAQGGQTAADIRNPAANFWRVVDQRLAGAGATADQVQVIWLKEANRQPGADGNPDTIPAARQLSDDLEGVVAVARARFANLKLVYLSSRIYAGYASTALNPEPYAYESGLAVRWLIERQITGQGDLDPAGGAPELLWGPYLWADGLTPRADGLVWHCEDFAQDGTHPGPSGRDKVAGLLLGFLKTHATSRGWFMADPDATPATPPTPDPNRTPTRPPPQTPGPGTGTPSGVLLRSYRVREAPSGDEMWVSTPDQQVQRRLENLRPGRPAFVCGPVRADRRAEWGFLFAPERVRVLPELPGGAVSATIRQIAADPRADLGGPPCIQVDGVTAEVEGPPPPATPPARSPTPTEPAAPGLETIYLPFLEN